MMIVFPCTACGAHQRAAEHLVGRMLRCQSCGSPMQIPGGSVPLPPRPPPGPTPTAANLLTQPSPAAATPAAEPSADDDLFFEHIRKGGRRQSKYL